VVVDDGDHVNETDEENNEATFELEVEGGEDREETGSLARTMAIIGFVLMVIIVLLVVVTRMSKGSDPGYTEYYSSGGYEYGNEGHQYEAEAEPVPYPEAPPAMLLPSVGPSSAGRIWFGYGGYSEDGYSDDAGEGSWAEDWTTPSQYSQTWSQVSQHWPHEGESVDVPYDYDFTYDEKPLSVMDAAAKLGVAKEQVGERWGSGPLSPVLTFDNFVVGSCNSTTHGSASRFAAGEETASPLCMIGPSGTGKTHLLTGIGHQVASGGKKVIYSSAMSFRSSFEETVSQGRVGDFRRFYEDCDLLLLDDVHFISGNERLQEAVFEIFEVLHSKGGKIAMTSDLPPTKIQNLERRLQTRFGGGLVMSLQQPDKETRLALLTRFSEELGLGVSDETLEHLADIFTGSVRELRGALNRFRVLSESEDRPVEEVAQDSMRYWSDPDLYSAEEWKEPAEREVTENPPKGSCYLTIEDETSSQGLGVFGRVLADGKSGDGLVMTNLKIETIEKRFPGVEILGLSEERVVGGNQVHAGRLVNEVLPAIARFLQDHPGGVICLQNLEYLWLVNGKKNLIKFLKAAADLARSTSSIFVVQIRRDACSAAELLELKSLFDVTA
jgi:hypothetical protein